MARTVKHQCCGNWHQNSKPETYNVWRKDERRRQLRRQDRQAVIEQLD